MKSIKKFFKEEEVLQEIRGRLQSDKSPIVVGIAGGSASGKTMLTRSLAGIGCPFTLLPLDNYQLGDDFKLKDASPYHWDDPLHFDPLAANEDLLSLIAGLSVQIPTFSLHTNVRGPTINLVPQRLIIVEGLYALSSPFLGNLDLKIYSEAPFWVRFLRRVLRFTREVDAQQADIPIRHMLGPVYKAHNDLITLQRSDCDIAFEHVFKPELELPIARLEGSSVTDQSKLTFSKEFPSEIRFEVFEHKDQTSLVCLYFKGSLLLQSEVKKSYLNSLSTIDWQQL